MRLFTGQKKRLTLTILDMAVVEEAPSMPAAKKAESEGAAQGGKNRRNGAYEGWGPTGLINSYCYR